MENGVAGAVPIPSNDAGKEEVIAALVTNVEAMIKADRKITALKELQVRRSVVKLFCPHPIQMFYSFQFQRMFLTICACLHILLLRGIYGKQGLKITS